MGEKTRKLGVLHHDEGVTLDGVVIQFLEAVSVVRRCKNLGGQRDHRMGVSGRRGRLGFEHFVEANDKFGNVV